MMRLFKQSILLLAIGLVSAVFADNQTPTVDTPIIAGDDFPFQVRIELADFELPNGIHSCVAASYKGKWVFLAGRTNGMHTFNNNDNNFPPKKQNTEVYVVDPVKGKVYSRSLTDPKSGLDSWQIDLLSVTSPQFYQEKETCYMTGGYGVDSESGEFSTKAFLTAIDLPGLIYWVTHPHSKATVAQHFRHLEDPVFKVTGGVMMKIKNHPTLLIVGQNFKGYYTDTSNGKYTKQVRRFIIKDDGKNLAVKVLKPSAGDKHPKLRRRDLNVVPIIREKDGKLVEEIDILSGVFTKTSGIWTVPVRVKSDGEFFMPDPNAPGTFKQGMNNYTCATLGMYSNQDNLMYTILLGGISFGTFKDGTFQTDPEIPFTNQVTTIELDKHNNYTQYLMDAKYPKIVSTKSNPGNTLLFGAGSVFMLANDAPIYGNQVLKFDDLKNHWKSSILVGYVVGGIASTVPNTSSASDSTASPFIFKVYIENIQQDSISDCGCGIILSDQ